MMLIRSFTPQDADAVFALEQKYAQVYPGALVIPGAYYLSPAFHAGQDVFCAFEGDTLLAYAPVYVQLVEDGPADLPHTAWVEIKADPDLPDPGPVKDALFACIQAHAQESAREAARESAPRRPLRMCFQYLSSEIPAVEYVQSKGFAYTESVFGMGRSLSEAISDVPTPAGISIRQWKMESEAEQRAYVTARNACFPEAPLQLAEWQYFMTSPLWAAGTTIAAFDGEELVGNVLIYWNDAEIAESGVQAGYTENIFVRAPWRGRGIAQAMITEGLRYLQAHGMAWARLEVRALNERALDVYKKLGFAVGRESRFYAKDLPSLF